MVIQWLGHSCFLITSADGTKILTDPYESGAFAGMISYAPITVAPDIVSISHDHADHAYTEGLCDHFEVCMGPGERMIRGIAVNGFESYHDQERGALRGSNTLFVMDIDGVRVCHLGDLGYELSGAEAHALGRVDILLIPVGGYYTIDAAQATRVMHRINASVVIPMHYKTDKVDAPLAYVDDFLRGKGEVVRMFSSEYEVTKDSLPTDHQEIVVLEHAL